MLPKVDQRHPDPSRASIGTTKPAAGSTTPLLGEGQLITRADVESFRQLGVQIEVISPLGTFWLVSARTGKDRMELTPEDAVVLANVVHVFGGRIVSLTRGGEPLLAVESAALGQAAPVRSEPAPTDRAGEPERRHDALEHLRRLRERTGERPAQDAQTTLFGADIAHGKAWSHP